jgi:hypothetical protein
MTGTPFNEHQLENATKVVLGCAVDCVKQGIEDVLGKYMEGLEATAAKCKVPLDSVTEQVTREVYEQVCPRAVDLALKLAENPDGRATSAEYNAAADLLRTNPQP